MRLKRVECVSETFIIKLNRNIFPRRECIYHRHPFTGAVNPTRYPHSDQALRAENLIAPDNVMIAKSTVCQMMRHEHNARYRIMMCNLDPFRIYTLKRVLGSLEISEKPRYCRISMLCGNVSTCLAYFSFQPAQNLQ